MNKFRDIILRETKGIIPKAPNGFYYLFYSSSCKLSSSTITGRLINGKFVQYTEARSFDALNSTTSFLNDIRFLGIGKYDEKYNHFN